MGLDVYTYTKEQQEANDAFEKKYPEDWYEKANEAERDAYHKEMMALPRQTDIPSTQYPDNINNRRYLRSSYNAGGFNRVVPEVLGDESASYYGIFEPLGVGDEYEIKVTDPALVEECRKRAQDVADRLEALRDTPVYRVDSERAISLRPQDNPRPGQPLTAEEALAKFKEQEETRNSDNGPFGKSGYSNALGSFWPDDMPMEVVGTLAGQDVLGAPCVHMVYKTKLHESYIESAHVLVEFCDELLELIDKDGVAYLHWSG